MLAWLAAIPTLLSKITGSVSEYLKHKAELKKIERETERQLALERQKYISELAKNDSERAKEALRSTGKWFKYSVFWLISSPFIACLIGQPWYAEQVFNNLNVLPEWYAVLYTGIIMVIFGIPVPGSVAGNIWEGLKETRRNNKQYKLEKLNRR